ncbi:hypothetical protein BSPWISOXPB_6199 [uncultured Gammaproteobacteria bacterium]|nr:hypothetical protein BSPWISOXPB_6199 [uncultured Gammaproteobacteria bacterium]
MIVLLGTAGKIVKGIKEAKALRSLISLCKWQDDSADWQTQIILQNTVAYTQNK